MAFKHSQFRTLWLAILLGATVVLVSRCGSGDDDDDDKGKDPSPVESPLPTSWDGKQDWTESKWSLEDE